MDNKSLNIGRESTVNGWATYENAVTESVFERFMTSGARINGRSRHLTGKQGLRFGAFGVTDRHLESSA